MLNFYKNNKPYINGVLLAGFGAIGSHLFGASLIFDVMMIIAFIMVISPVFQSFKKAKDKLRDNDV
jgi:uncharacterized membrane protein